tara:strand:- start:129 stop:368 length:240 start_codon:yes stop_codon:yes gene_type:complete
MLDQTSKDLIKTESKKDKIFYILNRRLEDFYGPNDKHYKRAYKILDQLYQSMNENQINIDFGFFLDDDLQKEQYLNRGK